jgi:hypothetical protein
MRKLPLLLLVFFATHSLIAQEPADTATKTVTDSADLYGYIPERPIKVGGGPAAQRSYLESLRDARGKRITFQRTRHCCPYKSNSTRAFEGIGLLDVYEITYKDENNKKKKISVYITFYDYETPRAIKGFTIE